MMRRLGAIVLMSLLAGGAGCAGKRLRPDCHGPWVSINEAQQVRPHG